MHVFTAGGFVATIVVLLLVLAGGAIPWRIALYVVLLMAAVATAIGALLTHARRWPTEPRRLSTGGFSRLPWSLLCMAIGLGGMATFGFIGDDGWWVSALVGLCAVGWLELAIGVGFGGPLKHAVAGSLHLAWHSRPERFAQSKPVADLRLELLDAPQYGVATPSDFRWNQLLGFDACVQCGRCEAVCPAFAAGQPLNPKKLIQDLVVGLSGPATDEQYHGSPHPGIALGGAHGAPQATIVPGLIAPDTLWSCTTCRACVQECPMLIEHVDAIIDMRRYQTMEAGITPGHGGIVLEALRITDNPVGAAPKARTHWAADLALPVLHDVRQCELLLWVGDAAFETSNHATLRSLVRLLKHAGVDFAYLGEEELDCGDLARRLGDDETFQALAARNVAILQQYRFNEIITADPHALHCLRNEYPAIGGRYTVTHHTALLQRLVEAGQLKLTRRLAGTVAYHDPCYLARYNHELDAPRALLDMTGLERREMQRAGLRARCCGGGGGAPITDVPGERRIADMRMSDARETGVETVAVACPNCAVMLKGVVEPRPVVRDVVEILLEAVDTSSTPRAMSLADAP
jgi:Fe-S oxidoreductase